MNFKLFKYKYSKKINKNIYKFIHVHISTKNNKHYIKLTFNILLSVGEYVHIPIDMCTKETIC